MTALLPAALSRLLQLFRSPVQKQDLDSVPWEEVVRLARHGRILGVLADRLLLDGAFPPGIPPAARGHLQAAINVSAHRAQMLRRELDALDRALPAHLQVTLLKGAAYQCQSLSLARGRVPADVDLLVRRDDLDATESALLAAGWECTIHDPYDLHYYRQWSHELPPLRFPGHMLEVDLHHTLAPPTGHVRPSESLLFAGLRPLPGSRFHVLDPADQIVHAALHLFQDSDLCGRIRDLLDLDGLARCFLRARGDWTRLEQRAQGHGATRALWYALHYCQCWLGTPVPADLTLPRPPRSARAAVDWIFTRTCPPRIPDESPRVSQRIADRLGLIRYHLLRMPLRLLIPHLARKGVRRVLG